MRGGDCGAQTTERAVACDRSEHESVRLTNRVVRCLRFLVMRRRGREECGVAAPPREDEGSLQIRAASDRLGQSRPLDLETDALPSGTV